MSYAVGQARPLRWLVAAPFSMPPTGRFVAATGERFQAVMSKLGPCAKLDVPDGLGAGPSRRVELQFQRPRDFRLAEAIKQIAPLARLWELADELERGGKLEAVVGKVRTSVGEGPLLRAVQQLVQPEGSPDGGSGGEDASPEPTPAAPPPSLATPASAPADAPAKGGSALDAIFGKADLAPAARDDAASAAKSGLDAFIGAMRKQGDGNAPVVNTAADRARSKQLADLLRRAAESVLLDVMAAPAVAALESSWRGLHMVISDSPGSGDLSIDLLDTDAEGLMSRLQLRLDVEPMDRPDAVFVALPIAAPEALRALAELGARWFVPIVVEVPDATTGTRLEDRAELPPLPEDWAELRREGASQWLCAVSNAVVLANEEASNMRRRVVFGSPVWGLCAMLSASVGQTGGPGNVFGRAGALVSPASHELSGGFHGGQAIPTRSLASVDQQRALADRGVLVLGGERGSDRLRLASAPTVYAGGRTNGDDLQLPGRILAGRAARFTRAVRDELPPHATAQEVAARLAEASTNFLPRSPRGAVALQVRTDAQGKLEVEATIGAALAGASIAFSSDL
jgi:type VI secretion system protein ImpC